MSSTLQTRLNRALAVLGTALVVATGAVLVACGGQDGDGGTATQAAPAAAGTDKVQITNFKYVPAMITVKAGTTITWTNNDSASHTSTSGKSPTPDGTFDTGIFKKDANATAKLTKPGTFEYYCELHPFMKATVIVK